MKGVSPSYIFIIVYLIKKARKNSTKVLTNVLVLLNKKLVLKTYTWAE